MNVENTQGRIFNIQHFSIHDGPGIRSTIFLMGCPLSCLWCHNPEGRGTTPFMGFDAGKCVGCAVCTRACPNGCHKISGKTHSFDRSNCSLCGRCMDACVYDALCRVGVYKDVDEVAEEVLRDKTYFDRSGGGVTLSGGEPLMQPTFCAALLSTLHTCGVHTAVETCGYAQQRSFEEILPYTDLFLFDCKETDTALHKQYTGVENGLILENLRFLNERKANIILRCPIIPGLNDRDAHFKGIADIAGRFPGILGVELLAYHSLGAGKTRRMGLPLQKQFTVPEKGMLAQWNDRLEKLGCRVIRR